MFKVRWFSVEPSGTYCKSETFSNEYDASVCVDELVADGHRALLLECVRGRWHICFDSDLGY